MPLYRLHPWSIEEIFSTCTLRHCTANVLPAVQIYYVLKHVAFSCVKKFDPVFVSIILQRDISNFNVTANKIEIHWNDNIIQSTLSDWTEEKQNLEEAERNYYE